MTVPVPTLLTGSQSGTNLTTYTTASVSASAGDGLLVFTQFIGGARTVTVTGSGLTFSVEAEAWFNSGNDEQGCHFAVVPGGGFTGTLSITGSGGGNQCHWTVIKLDAGTFDATTPIPQFDHNTGTGTAYSATLASPVSADSRTFGISGHLVFEGTATGTLATEFHDSPGNSGGSPLGRAYAAGWRSDAFETGPTMSGATSAAWGMLAVEVAGASSASNYDEDADTVISATTGLTDAVAASETVATVVAATTGETDAQAMAEIVATVIAATTTIADAVAQLETVATIIVATTGVTDELTGASNDYVEAADTIISSTTEVTDSVSSIETLSTTILGTTTVADASQLAELVETIVAATTTVVSALVASDVVATTILATTTVDDVFVVFVLDLNPQTETFMEQSNATFKEGSRATMSETGFDTYREA